MTACPLARYQDLLWTVDVLVGGAPRRFLFDLGAGVSAVDARLAAELDLQTVGHARGKRMTGEQLDLSLVGPLGLVVADVRLAPRPIAKADLASFLPPDWPRLDGVLALDVLEDHAFSADFGGDRLDLGPRADMDELSVVPVRPLRQIPGVSLVLLVGVRTPGGTRWFELDSGNSGPVVVSPATASDVGLTARSAEIDLEVIGLPPFRTAVVTKDILYDGNLGRSFVDGRTLAFDLPKSLLAIGPLRR